MRSPAAVLLLIPLFLHPGVAAAVDAQVPEASSSAFLQYSLERKSEWAAVGLEWLVPIVGHAYAGNAKRGILPAIVTVGGMVALAGGAGCDSLCAVGGKTRNNDDLVWAGLAAVVAGRAWGMISAHQTAAGRNAELRTRLGITTAAHDGRPELRVRLRI